jgi:hypothetical protein
MFMHFHAAKDEPGHWDPTLLECGRELLRSFPPDQIQQFNLKRAVTPCLT